MAALSALLGYADQQDFQLAEPTEPITPPAPDATPLILEALQQRLEVNALQLQVESAQKKAPPNTIFGARR